MGRIKVGIVGEDWVGLVQRKEGVGLECREVWRG